MREVRKDCTTNQRSVVNRPTKYTMQTYLTSWLIYYYYNDNNNYKKYHMYLFVYFLSATFKEDNNWILNTEQSLFTSLQMHNKWLKSWDYFSYNYKNTVLSLKLVLIPKDCQFLS